MKILITGYGGFTGGHLARYLLGTEGVTITGTVSSTEKACGGAGQPADSRVEVVECDMRNPARVRAVVEEARPDYIFHLAAITSERLTRADPELAFKTNVFGTMHLLDAVRLLPVDPVILVSGSSASFGLVREDENPIKESNPQRPVSPYAVSKIAQSMAAYQYFLAYGLRVVRTNTFNCAGPGQSDDFVCSAFARQIVRIEKGLAPPVMRVGNLDAMRDFTDVRDVAGAYWLAVNKGIPGAVYNICSGRAYSVKEILGRLLAISGVEVEVGQDPDRMRPSDVPLQVGDFSRFGGLTGWRPEIDIDKTLLDTLEHWRGAL